MCSIIGELTKQLLLQAPSIPDEVWPLFQKHTAINKKTAQQIFTLLLNSFGSIYVCIDALDECQPQFREELIGFFTALKRTTLRIFCTGRPSITAEVTESLGPLGVKTVEICAHETDVRLYIEEKVSRDRHKKAMDEQLHGQITKELVPHKL